MKRRVLVCVRVRAYVCGECLSSLSAYRFMMRDDRTSRTSFTKRATRMTRSTLSEPTEPLVSSFANAILSASVSGPQIWNEFSAIKSKTPTAIERKSSGNHVVK